MPKRALLVLARKMRGLLRVLSRFLFDAYRLEPFQKIGALVARYLLLTLSFPDPSKSREWEWVQPHQLPGRKYSEKHSPCLVVSLNIGNPNVGDSFVA